MLIHVPTIRKCGVVVGGGLHESSQYGNVEKNRQRRSRPFAVLTSWEYAPRVKLAAALLEGPFGKTQGMLF